MGDLVGAEQALPLETLSAQEAIEQGGQGAPQPSGDGDTEALLGAGEDRSRQVAGRGQLEEPLGLAPAVLVGGGQRLDRVDQGRVEAAVFEHRVQAVLDGVPVVMVQCGVVAAWATYFMGGWNLATAILVSGAVNGFDWFLIGLAVAADLASLATGGRYGRRRSVAAT